MTATAIMRDSEAQTPSFAELVSKIVSLPVPFPTTDNRIDNIVARAGNHCTSPEARAVAEAAARRQIEEDAASTRVAVHSSVWRLIHDFLDWKRQYGSPIERELYSGMDPEGLVSRLVVKRPLAFLGQYDYTLLRDGEELNHWDPRQAWDAVGTLDCRRRDGPPSVCTCPCSMDTEHGRQDATEGPIPHLSLLDYLSYDEMQISSLLCASTPTFFINSGGRSNSAVACQPGSYERHGVYLGLVGPRFQRVGRMDDEAIIIRPTDPTSQIPLRLGEPPKAAHARVAMWMRLFGVPEDYWENTVKPLQEKLSCGVAESYGRRDEAIESESRRGGDTELHLPSHVVQLKDGALFNVLLYKARVRISAETMLLEANARGQVEGKQAYLHVVGLGLGVWQVHGQQPQWYVGVFHDALQSLQLPWVGVVNFSWIKGVNRCGDVPSGSFLSTGNGNRVKILFSRRDPAARLDEDFLLVATYAWDGNSFPGNEFWTGNLSASGDGAASCCSTVAQLQNPLVNDYSHNLAVLL